MWKGDTNSMPRNNKCRDLSTFGGRLAYYRNKAGFTQETFADELNQPRSVISDWENNKKHSYTHLMDKICGLLGVDENKLLTNYTADNETITKTIGLPDDCIEYLKTLYTDNANRWLENNNLVKAMTINANENEMMLNTIKVLLSNETGHRLLRCIGVYCFGQMDKIYPQYDSPFVQPAALEDGTVAKIDYLSFNVAGMMGQEQAYVNPDVVQYALLKDTEKQLEELRKDVQENGKR